jgi:hypothetical protein
MDLRPRFVHAPGNTSRRVIGKLREETRSRRPIRATHDVNQATSEIPSFFSFEMSRLQYETPI